MKKGKWQLKKKVEFDRRSSCRGNIRRIVRIGTGTSM